MEKLVSERFSAFDKSRLSSVISNSPMFGLTIAVRAEWEIIRNVPYKGRPSDFERSIYQQGHANSAQSRTMTRSLEAHPRTSTRLPVGPAPMDMPRRPQRNLMRHRFVKAQRGFIVLVPFGFLCSSRRQLPKYRRFCKFHCPIPHSIVCRRACTRKSAVLKT